MKHQKTIRREDGSQVRIEIGLRFDFGSSLPIWEVEVNQRAKGKRNWLGTHSTDDYTWRRLDQRDREIYRHNVHLKHVTEAELKEAKLELIDKIKLSI